jgi:hypothetical protein
MLSCCPVDIAVVVGIEFDNHNPNEDLPGLSLADINVAEDGPIGAQVQMNCAT